MKRRRNKFPEDQMNFLLWLTIVLAGFQVGTAPVPAKAASAETAAVRRNLRPCTCEPRPVEPERKSTDERVLPLYRTID